MTYPVTDTLTRIKNAYMARRERLTIPFSRLRFNLARVLQEKSFVGEVEEKGRGEKRYLAIALVYLEGGGPAMTDFKTISKPSQRIYASKEKIRRTRRGGIFVVSTPAGVMSGQDARKKNVGGEVLCEVW